MTQPTASQIARARRIAAKALRDRNMPSPSYEAIDVEAGKYDEHSAVQAALAAIIETQEACAKVADRLGGVRGPHDAVSPSNRAQHTRARTIAAAIRAGEQP